MGATKLRHKPRVLHAPIKMAARGKFEPARGPFLAAGKKNILGWAEYEYEWRQLETLKQIRCKR